MTEDTKLQCYYKSIGHDAYKLKDMVVSALRVVAVPTIVILIVCAILYGIYYGVTTNPVLFTQQVTYLCVIAGMDVAFLLIYYLAERNHTYLCDLSDPVVLLLFFTFLVWLVNAFLTIGTSGWSYMHLETVLNIVLMIAVIFVVRAYVRCEIHQRRSE